jgi:indole-3-glycerol phosphate synthase
MDARPIAGLSVVTEPRDFGGSLELLHGLSRIVEAPILRKDFVHEPEDVQETVEAGASALLLTVSLLADPLLSELHAAAKASGLETLVETHDRDEIDRVVSLGLEPDVLGINNRDILVLETDDGDVSQTEGLASCVPPGWLVLSESAIEGPADASRARDAGADAVLVGTAILQAEDPVAAIDALVAIGWRDKGAGQAR